MHPCGAYRYNSLAQILSAERPDTLHIVHRLDRLTSGVTIFAKSPEIAQSFGAAMKAGKTQKLYLARVAGDFGSALDQRWRRDSLPDEGAVGWAYQQGGIGKEGGSGSGSGSGGGGGGSGRRAALACVGHESGSVLGGDGAPRWPAHTSRTHAARMPAAATRKAVRCGGGECMPASRRDSRTRVRSSRRYVHSREAEAVVLFVAVVMVVERGPFPLLT